MRIHKHLMEEIQGIDIEVGDQLWYSEWNPEYSRWADTKINIDSVNKRCVGTSSPFWNRSAFDRTPDGKYWMRKVKSKPYTPSQVGDRDDDI